MPLSALDHVSFPQNAHASASKANEACTTSDNSMCGNFLEILKKLDLKYLGKC